MNITENNILIAEFMQFQNTDLGWYDFEETLSESETDNTFDVLKFDTDWNWLMAVVEKIENLKTPITNNPNLIGQFEDYEIHIEGNNVIIYAHGEVTKDICHIKKETKIQTVYNACVEFIEWYNQQKK
jgi:hypothetical protein